MDVTSLKSVQVIEMAALIMNSLIKLTKLAKEMVTPPCTSSLLVITLLAQVFSLIMKTVLMVVTKIMVKA